MIQKETTIVNIDKNIILPETIQKFRQFEATLDGAIPSHEALQTARNNGQINSYTFLFADSVFKKTTQYKEKFPNDTQLEEKKREIINIFLSGKGIDLDYQTAVNLETIRILQSHVEQPQVNTTPTKKRRDLASDIFGGSMILGTIISVAWFINSFRNQEKIIPQPTPTTETFTPTPEVCSQQDYINQISQDTGFEPERITTDNPCGPSYYGTSIHDGLFVSQASWRVDGKRVYKLMYSTLDEEGQQTYHFNFDMPDEDDILKLEKHYFVLVNDTGKYFETKTLIVDDDKYYEIGINNTQLTINHQDN